MSTQEAGNSRNEIVSTKKYKPMKNYHGQVESYASLSLAFAVISLIGQTWYFSIVAIIFAVISIILGKKSNRDKMFAWYLLAGLAIGIGATNIVLKFFV